MDWRRRILYSLPFTMAAAPEDARASNQRRAPRMPGDGREPPGSQLQIDTRHIIAAAFAAILASGVVGSIVMYGMVQEIRPTLRHLEAQTSEANRKIERLESRLESRIESMQREMWQAPPAARPQSSDPAYERYLRWLLQE